MNKATIRIKAAVEAMDEAISPIIELLETFDTPHKVCYKVRLALDELLTNVVSYAYDGGEGEIEVRYEIGDNPRSITIVIIDEGKPFDPLQAEDPELTASVAERKIGGLGIFLVKSVMDEIKYKREDGKNMLLIRKNI